MEAAKGAARSKRPDQQLYVPKKHPIESSDATDLGYKSQVKVESKLIPEVVKGKSKNTIKEVELSSQKPAKVVPSKQIGTSRTGVQTSSSDGANSIETSVQGRYNVCEESVKIVTSKSEHSPSLDEKLESIVISNSRLRRVTPPQKTLKYITEEGKINEFGKQKKNRDSERGRFSRRTKSETIKNVCDTRPGSSKVGESRSCENQKNKSNASSSSNVHIAQTNTFSQTFSDKVVSVPENKVVTIPENKAVTIPENKVVTIPENKVEKPKKTEDKPEEKVVLEVKKTPYKPQILDWSAEVEESDETEDSNFEESRSESKPHSREKVITDGRSSIGKGSVRSRDRDAVKSRPRGRNQSLKDQFQSHSKPKDAREILNRSRNLSLNDKVQDKPKIIPLTLNRSADASRNCKPLAELTESRSRTTSTDSRTSISLKDKAQDKPKAIPETLNRSADAGRNCKPLTELTDSRLRTTSNDGRTANTGGILRVEHIKPVETPQKSVLSDNKINTSGIIRVDSPRSSEVRSRTVSGGSHYLKGSENVREFGSKQLFDPDHPEKPLCIVPPASHLASERKNYSSNLYSANNFQNPHIPFGSPTDSVNPLIQSIPFGRGMPSQVAPFGSGNYFSPGNTAVPDYQSFGVTYSVNATEKNIREILMLESQLSILLNAPFQMMDLKRLGQCRWKIQLRYEATILSDLEFSTKHNVEQSLWKSAFYQVIETFRRQMVEEPTRNERLRQSMLNLIDEGSVFYENLLEKLQDTYGFHLSNFLDSNAIRPTTLSRSVKLALLSAQKVTICLGDLVRYREQATDGCSYGKARNWYLKAQQLAPKNGRPYNQLAILAVYARRKLDAVYYYMRSLSASNPFQSAKEGLINIFDDARKKYEMSNESKSVGITDLSRRRRNKRVEPKRRLKRDVVEVWYSPDGQVVNHDAMEDNEESSNSDNNDEHVIRNMQPVDLSKTFSLSFLHVHGKLYSRVGMETFTGAVVKMFREFRYLLQIRPSAFNSQRFVQIVTINMFAIDNAGLKGTEVMIEPHCQTVIQGKALEVGVEMFRLIVARCEELLQEEFDSSLNFTEELNNLLPAVKVWCDWFLCHPGIWNPLPSLTDYGIGFENKDVWTHLASLLNILKRWDTVEPFLTNPLLHNDCEPVILPEDTSLAGFVPLLALPQETVFVRAPMDKEFSISLFRIKRILYCGEFLCGIRPAVLDYNVETQSYIPLTIDSTSQPNLRVQEVATENDSTDSVVDSVEEPSEEWDTDDPLDANSIATLQLRSRKHQLEKVKAHKEQQQRQIQAVLQEVSESRDIRFEVHPKRLIPDTNCFIDHLTDIQKLISTGRFNLVVPLVVINELEGLAKNVRNCSNVNSHYYKVGQEAQKALKCLGEWTSQRNPYVRAITAKGSLLDTIAFRSETDNYDKTTNDDIILSCCMHLCDGDSKKGKSSTPQKRKDKDNAVLICRDVVLLTEDRNLRVKAHAQEMPVKDIPRFMRLMNLTGH